MGGGLTSMVDWAASRARMVVAFIILSLVAGGLAYTGLPKEGEPDIEVPAIFISVPFPGISAEDSERLLIEPMETELADLDGLDVMTGTAFEGYAGMALEFEFGWDKSQTMADVREAMNSAEALFPEGAEKYTVNEFNFSEFPIVIVNLTGPVPEQALLRVAEDLQDRLEALEPVLEAGLAGHRDEMFEVLIDPLKLEAYDVTAGELINAVTQNNLLIAAGEVDSEQGAFSVKIPSTFDSVEDIYSIKVVGDVDRSVTLGELTDIRLTFEDRTGTAHFNGEKTVALQVVKRKGFNLIDTAELVRAEVAAASESWPSGLQSAVLVGTSNDQSFVVQSMVSQLEGSVLTAIALVMIVVLASLGIRSALLVGFAIPTSFLLCFVLLSIMGITVSNIVMFGLILAVGMLVDGAIVVVEYADRRISEGAGPMQAYTKAAKRMFWPIVSSTATTLCAFLPMLFWPGVPGEFMGMLPVTLIFVLSASLVVALIYLPVMGGVTGRIGRKLQQASQVLRAKLPWWGRTLLLAPVAYLLFVGAMLTLNPNYFAPPGPDGVAASGFLASLPGMILFTLAAMALSVVMGSIRKVPAEKSVESGTKRTPFGYVMWAIVGNPFMPIVAVLAVGFFVMSTFSYFGQNNLGVEFFVDSEPEQAIVYVQARGNLSLAEKDALVSQVEEVVLSVRGVESAFSFAGEGGLNSNTGGASGPRDTIGQVQLELIRWDNRPRDIGDPFLGFVETRTVAEEYDGDFVLAEIERRLAEIPGIRTEILNLSRGPASPKPVHLRLKANDMDTLREATLAARAQFDNTFALLDVEDTLPLPGIDWRVDVDLEAAGRFGADVALVGAMVQLVTRGLLLDTMRVPSSDEEIEIRVRFPEEYRVLSTLDTMKVRTSGGLMPLTNFISLTPVAKLAQVDRVDQKRYFDVKANVGDGFLKVERDVTAEDGTVTTETVDIVRRLTEEDLAAGKTGDYTIAGDARQYEFVESRSDTPLGDDETVRLVPINPNERIALLTEWLSTPDALPEQVTWEWTGDQEDQAESQAFLQSAFAGALGLMFIILLAQFNSFYNSILVLTAVVLSTTGVLIGMLVMQQPFSIIMTGTGIVALAGIVVNNNIVLIDTYQEYSRYMPRVEAIIRTAETRLRPVLLTTITTMAGLAPMMFGLSLDFINGGYSVNSPTALWWTQLATAVVFGLGIATFLTLIFTPAMLAIRAWVTTYALALAQLLARLSLPAQSQAARDWALRRQAKQAVLPDLIWEEGEEPAVAEGPDDPESEAARLRMLQLRAAE
ncbi:MAG: efflux RND transporter permease subunit [Pseudomonadota bacterium]